MSKLHLSGLEALRPSGDAAADTFYQASARNKASQCQATLVVRLPVCNEASEAEEQLSSPRVAEEVASAYYSKLLEDIVGVEPRGPALQLATETLGLTRSNVRQHTRVIGGALQVAGTAPQPSLPPGLPAAQLQLFDALQPIVKQKESNDIAGSHEVAGLIQQQTDGNRFAEYVKLYTYPYNKQKKLSKVTAADQQDAAVTAQTTILHQQWNKMCTADRRSVSEVCPGAAAAVAAAEIKGVLVQPGKAARQARTACAEQSYQQPILSQAGAQEQWRPDHLQELSQDFVVSARLVQAYHTSFSQQMTSHMLDHHQPEMDRGALTAADVTAARQLLQTAAVTRLSVTLVYYLYTKFIADTSSVPAHVLQHLRAQAQADRKSKGGKRPTLAAAHAPVSMGAAADESDTPERWDMGCQLLLQKKADEAAQQHSREAAAAAAAAERLAQRQTLLPPGVGKCSKRLMSVLPGQGRYNSNTGSEDLGAGSSRGFSTPGSSRPGSDAGGLQHQESSCSSGTRSRNSLAGSLSSYKQAVEAAQYHAQLLASASTEELQSCRLSGILQTWDELVRSLSRSAHGTSFALPVLLLSLQVLVRELFGDTFPMWSNSKMGAEVLRQITAAVPLMLDPQQTFNTIMVLAGSPAAVGVRQMCDAGPLVAVDKRSRRVGLSSVVAAAVGGSPNSPAVRQMMHAAQSSTKSPISPRAQPVVLGAELVHTAAAQRLNQHVRRG